MNVQGRFENLGSRSRRRQSALIDGTEQRCADCRRRLRLLELALTVRGGNGIEPAF